MELCGRDAYVCDDRLTEVDSKRGGRPLGGDWLAPGYPRLCVLLRLSGLNDFSLYAPAIIGPLALEDGRGKYYAIAGNWCFISNPYADARLWLHYVPVSRLHLFHLNADCAIDSVRRIHYRDPLQPRLPFPPREPDYLRRLH